jgi:Tol biopolymer transport system component
MIGRETTKSPAAVIGYAIFILVVATLAPTAASRSETPALGTAADPAWSPDGTRIAFAGYPVAEPGVCCQPGALYVINADGGGLKQLTPEAQRLRWPTWSPDSRQIAFASEHTIHVVNADGSKLGKLGQGYHPEWSPGGRRIAFNDGTLDTDDGSILVMKPNGSARRVVAEYNGTTAYSTPTWSQDGQRLAFIVVDAPDTAGGTIPHLAYISQYGGKVRELSHAKAFEPDWSPDGRRILFSNGGVRVLDLRRQRTTFLRPGFHPRWSPDGHKIVFASGPAYAGASSQLFVMAEDGSNVRQLTP